MTNGVIASQGLASFSSPFAAASLPEIRKLKGCCAYLFQITPIRLPLS
jgi:hypothetical protein